MSEGAVLLEPIPAELRAELEDAVILVNGAAVWPVLILHVNGTITARYGQKTALLDGATLRDGEIRVPGDQLPLGVAVVSQVEGRVYVEPVRARPKVRWPKVRSKK